MAGSAKIPHLMENMKDLDKDLRFMALQDLKGILTAMKQDDARLEKPLEAKLVTQWSEMLDDSNAEVQNESTNCIPPLLAIVTPVHVTKIVQSLVDNLLKGTECQRDIAAIGLQNVVRSLGPESAQTKQICVSLVEQTMVALTSESEDSLILEILDLFLEVALRMGKGLAPHHNKMSAAFFDMLAHPRMAVRKRAVRAFGAMVPAVEDALFGEIVTHVAERLDVGVKRTKSGTAQIGADRDARVYVELSATLSREDAERFAPFLETVVPSITTILDSNDSDEVRECCIQAFEAFVVRCPRHMEPHMSKLLDFALTYLTHDPNYVYDDDEEDEMGGSDDEDEFGEDDDDDDYADDDDISWRVRRSCASFMARVIENQPNMLGSLAERLTPTLVGQFKEREQSVRIEIFLTYRALLVQVRAIFGGENDSADAMEEDGAVKVVADNVEAVVRVLSKQHKDKNLKVRQGFLGVLTEIAQSLPGALEPYLEAILNQVQHVLADSTSSANVKIDALVLLTTLFKTHTAEAFQPLLLNLAPAVVTAVNDSFYKVAAEGLRTVTRMVGVMRPQLEKPVEPELTNVIDLLYEPVFKRFSAVDIDQEIKEHAILCMAQMVSVLGDELADQVAPCLPIFLSRLQNEITRITATKAIAHIAASPLHIDMSPIAQEVYLALASFLRKTSRQLRVTSLMALQVLVDAYDEGTQTELCGLLENIGGVQQKSKRRKVHVAEVTASAVEAFSIILTEIPPLIEPSDLTSTHQSLQLVTQIIRIHPALAERLESDIPIVPALLKLSISPILQGGALLSLQQCFRKLATSGVAALGVEPLLQMLLDPILSQAGGADLAIPKQAFTGLAKCIATLAALNPGGVIPLAQKFLVDVEAAESSESLKMISLFVLGEIGRDIDMSQLGDIQSIISSAFASPSENVKKAAAFALGNVSAGNAALFLPNLLAEIRSQPAHGYLLLHALKELVSCKAATPTGSQALITFVKEIWDLLFDYSAAEDEGTRSVVAECIGRIVLVDAAKHLPELIKHLQSESPAMRCTMVQAFKIITVSQIPGIDDLLRPLLPDFFKLVSDPDLNVRRVALVTFNSAVYNKPHLVKPILEQVLPMLYRETSVREEHIRVVQLGMFTEKFDDGLDARKTAFECLFTVLERCYDFVTIPEYLHEVSKGLNDQHDIQVLVHMCLSVIVKRSPSCIKDAMRDLTQYFNNVLNEKPKKSDVRVQVEKREDRHKAVCRTVKAFTNIEGADSIEALAILVRRIQEHATWSTFFGDSDVERVGSGRAAAAMEMA